MKAVRKIIEIDEERCDGCGQCVISCAEGAIEIIEGKAKLVKDSYCDGLGACLGECPQGALQVVEREADEFDPEAVEHHLAAKSGAATVSESPSPFQCPSGKFHFFEKPTTESSAEAAASIPSALSHWPVQVRLVPPGAPFLKEADLLVAADCVPVAYGGFHRDFLQGKVVLLGCPKFDDAAQYVEKFAEIFRTANIKSVTVVDMEVPCCSALPAIVKKGMQEAGKEVPTEEVVISVRGQLLGRKKLAA
jgi:Pyruvate/2-oxoacid:ferredoxin oxidoreductase delta subunit